MLEIHFVGPVRAGFHEHDPLKRHVANIADKESYARGSHPLVSRFGTDTIRQPTAATSDARFSCLRGTGVYKDAVCALATCARSPFSAPTANTTAHAAADFGVRRLGSHQRHSPTVAPKPPPSARTHPSLLRRRIEQRTAERAQSINRPDLNVKKGDFSQRNLRSDRELSQFAQALLLPAREASEVGVVGVRADEPVEHAAADGDVLRAQ
eukprot:297223-Pleurochrysis_carterae.AAC.4